MTSLKHKLWMAATGLFLCFFLVVHLLGNLQLFLPVESAREQFNAYSHFLSGNVLIKTISYILYGSIIAHTVFSILITLRKRNANGIGYVNDMRGGASVWYSRNMGLLGTIIFLFLIIHFKDFWYQYNFEHMPFDDKGNKDLYTIVIKAYQQLGYVLIYEAALVALGFHLLHGFFSAARTLGVFHPKYVRSIRLFGWIYTTAITLGFMAIPVYVYLEGP
jgi:succinate dehydrogenase / fumarate reductase cytochrome b subunit